MINTFNEYFMGLIAVLVICVVAVFILYLMLGLVVIGLAVLPYTLGIALVIYLTNKYVRTTRSTKTSDKSKDSNND